MTLNKKQRNILRTKKIYSTLKLPSEGKVVDVSCGGGRLLKKIELSNPSLELVGVDVSPGYLAQRPELSNISFHTSEAHDLPFDDNTFEVSICSLSFHHYPDAKSVLSEIVRVTKDGGKIYIIDVSPKNSWSQFIYNLVGCTEPYHFQKYYTKREFDEMLSDFRVSISKSNIISLFPRTVSYETEIKK